MTIADVRTKTEDQLKDELVALRKEQLNLRFQKSTGQLENTALIREARKKIARVKTVLIEKKNGVEVKAKAAPKKKKTETKAKKPAAKKTADKKADKKKKA
jgi:large subunit ribosomal protein L29